MNFNEFTRKTKSLLHWLRRPGDNLSRRVIHGGFWVMLIRVFNRGFSLIRIIVLARLLAPNDFGLFGIALLVLNSLHHFSRTGFNKAIIQKKENTEPYLDSAWTIQVVRGILLGSILFAGAPLVGSFFSEPQAIIFIRVLGISEFIKDLRNIGVVYFKKELEFHKQFIYRFSGTFADLAVALTIAFVYRSVWALILGLLAKNLARTVISYAIHSYRPNFSVSWHRTRELFNFGRWIFLSGALVFLYSQGDDFFVGRILGTTALGYYQMAYRISNLPSSELTHVLSKVTFPAYSKIQDDLVKLKKAYSKTLEIITFLSFPITGFIFFLAPLFTRIFLGSKWMGMVGALQVLAWWGLMRAISATTGPVFRGIGKPHIVTMLQFANVVGLVVLIYPFSNRWGITGTSWAVLLGTLFGGIMGVYIVIKELNMDISSTLRKFLFPFLGSLVSVSFMWLLQRYSFFSGGLLGFLLTTMAGGLLYLAVIFGFTKFFGYELFFTIKKEIKKI